MGLMLHLNGSLHFNFGFPSSHSGKKLLLVLSKKLLNIIKLKIGFGYQLKHTVVFISKRKREKKILSHKELLRFGFRQQKRLFLFISAYRDSFENNCISYILLEGETCICNICKD